jgi:hypothetical protein
LDQENSCDEFLFGDSNFFLIPDFFSSLLAEHKFKFIKNYRGQPTVFGEREEKAEKIEKGEKR